MNLLQCNNRGIEWLLSCYLFRQLNFGSRPGADVRKGQLSSCLHVDRHCIQTAKLSSETLTSGKLLLFP